jgi:hypothetical protein
MLNLREFFREKTTDWQTVRSHFINGDMTDIALAALELDDWIVALMGPNSSFYREVSFEKEIFVFQESFR